jgi:hypothetical protein
MKRYRGRPTKQVPSIVNGWEVGDYGSDARYSIICISCGKDRKASPRALYNKTLRVCECSRQTNEDLYKKWQSLRAQIKHDPYYQERGVKIEFGSYSEFKQELGEPAGLQLKRIDTNANFRPGNVIWA